MHPGFLVNQFPLYNVLLSSNLRVCLFLPEFYPCNFVMHPMFRLAVEKLQGCQQRCTSLGVLGCTYVLHVRAWGRERMRRICTIHDILPVIHAHLYVDQQGLPWVCVYVLCTCLCIVSLMWPSCKWRNSVWPR